MPSITLHVYVNDKEQKMLKDLTELTGKSTSQLIRDYIRLQHMSKNKGTNKKISVTIGDETFTGFVVKKQTKKEEITKQ